MSTRHKFVQQPAEVISYDVDFGPWVEDRDDAVISHTIDADPGLTVTSSLAGNVVKVIASGGADGAQYQVTVRATTAASLVKETEFVVRIKDL
jgi:hypothetical protein